MIMRVELVFIFWRSPPNYNNLLWPLGSMSSITKFSSQISEKLRSRRQDVATLSSTHATLQVTDV